MTETASFPADLDDDGRRQLQAMRDTMAHLRDVEPELEPLPFPVPDFGERLLADLVRNSPPHATVPLRVLRKSGLRLRSPDKVHGDKVGEELWLAVHAMALLGFYLLNTDHLSDQELYRIVYDEVLQEPTMLRASGYGPGAEAASFMHDLATGDGEAGLRAWLTYYADDMSDDERLEMWARDEPLPERREPPYDRDRYLP